jgi:hypothetical protein
MKKGQAGLHNGISVVNPGALHTLLDEKINQSHVVHSMGSDS